MNLDMVDRNSAPEEFAYIWQSKGVGIITIETEKNMNSLFHATFSWLSAVVVSLKISLRWFSRYVIVAMLVDGKQKIAH